VYITRAQSCIYFKLCSKSTILVSLRTVYVSDSLRCTWHTSQRIRASGERATHAPCGQ